MINAQLDLENNKEQGNDQIEQQSYNKIRLKKVKKLREKGKLIGVKVPYLKYPLQKTKPSIIFIILSIISVLLTIAVTVGLGYFVIGKGWYQTILDCFNLGVASATRQTWDVLGIVQAFGILGTIVSWVLGVTLIMLVIAPVAIFTSMSITFISMIRLSIQEKAHGSTLTKFIIALILIIVIPIIVIVVMWYQSKSTGTNWGLLIGLWAVVAAVCGVILALILVEKIQASKKFKQLPIEQQDDFKQHNNALEKIARYSNRMKSKGIGDF